MSIVDDAGGAIEEGHGFLRSRTVRIPNGDFVAGSEAPTHNIHAYDGQTGGPSGGQACERHRSVGVPPRCRWEVLAVYDKVATEVVFV